jgi:hypothetical protein
MPRIGEPRLHVLERELESLDLQMPAVSAGMRRGRQIKALENAEAEQRRDARTVGRHLPDLVAAIRGIDRLYPFALVCGEIVGGEPAAGGARTSHQGLGDLPRIKVIGTHLCQPPQCCRVPGRAKHLARLRHAALRRKHFPPPGERRVTMRQKALRPRAASSAP